MYNNDIDPRHDDLHLSVDDRKDRPFHCDYCGNTYEACCHWSNDNATSLKAPGEQK